jgi:hypothetical protein
MTQLCALHTFLFAEVTRPLINFECDYNLLLGTSMKMIQSAIATAAEIRRTMRLLRVSSFRTTEIRKPYRGATVWFINAPEF